MIHRGLSSIFWESKAISSILGSTLFGPASKNATLRPICVATSLFANPGHFLTNGANPNISDSEGHTPLHIAAFEGNTSIAERLLKNGAEIKTNNSGKTPIEIAEERGNSEFINFIKEVTL